MPRRALARTSAEGSDDDWALTQSQIRELNRRIADLEDRTRYLLVSAFSRRFVLYYDVSRDVWAANDPAGGTLFKRRGAAVAIKALLRGSVDIVRCRVNGRERLVKNSVQRIRSSSPPVRRPRARRSRAGNA
jgi:hypothetical protein